MQLSAQYNDVDFSELLSRNDQNQYEDDGEDEDEEEDIIAPVLDTNKNDHSKNNAFSKNKQNFNSRQD